jgi:hypothetical protein
MVAKQKRSVYKRGMSTIELPFLVSCALHLLDRRIWVLGIRHPLHGIRFDLLGKVPSVAENVVLVECKYRKDGRPVRPYEIQRFASEVAIVKGKQPACFVTPFFMASGSFSKQALEAARRHRIRTFAKVPLLFRLVEEGNDATTTKENFLPSQDSSSSNRAPEADEA